MDLVKVYRKLDLPKKFLILGVLVQLILTQYMPGNPISTFFNEFWQLNALIFIVKVVNIVPLGLTFLPYVSLAGIMYSVGVLYEKRKKIRLQVNRKLRKYRQWVRDGIIAGTLTTILYSLMILLAPLNQLVNTTIGSLVAVINDVGVKPANLLLFYLEFLGEDILVPLSVLLTGFVGAFITAGFISYAYNNFWVGWKKFTSTTPRKYFWGTNKKESITVFAMLLFLLPVIGLPVPYASYPFGEGDVEIWVRNDQQQWQDAVCTIRDIYNPETGNWDRTETKRTSNGKCKFNDLPAGETYNVKVACKRDATLYVNVRGLVVYNGQKSNIYIGGPEFLENYGIVTDGLDCDVCLAQNPCLTKECGSNNDIYCVNDCGERTYLYRVCQRYELCVADTFGVRCQRQIDATTTTIEPGCQVTNKYHGKRCHEGDVWYTNNCGGLTDIYQICEKNQCLDDRCYIITTTSTSTTSTTLTTSTTTTITTSTTLPSCGIGYRYDPVSKQCNLDIILILGGLLVAGGSYLAYINRK